MVLSFSLLGLETSICPVWGHSHGWEWGWELPHPWFLSLYMIFYYFLKKLNSGIS